METFKYLIFAVAILIVLAYIYIYIKEQNIVQFYYYTIQCQLYDVYKSKIGYYDILFNFTFVFIIMIMSIVLYWDSVYKNAKKISNCNNIIKIIEENKVSKTPYIYNIIIINHDKISLSSHNYLIKIIYNFKSKKTKIEYGTDTGTDNNVFNSMGPEYDKILNTVKMLEDYSSNNENIKNKYLNNYNKLYDLITKSDEIDEKNLNIKLIDIFDDNNNSIKNEIIEFIKIYDVEKAENAIKIFSKYNNKIYEDTSDINKIKNYIKRLYNELIELLEISSYKSMKLAKINLIKNSELYKRALKYKQNKSNYKNFNYFDLNTMNGMSIDNINIVSLNSTKYKFVCVDKDGNVIKTYTANKLIEFTKEFSKNKSYNTSIIYNILFANKNKDKISL
tara:strand:- start:20 stop:1192 length:1173 start_codon:yes stop_codon:yes gene_type:complete